MWVGPFFSVWSVDVVCSASSVIEVWLVGVLASAVGEDVGSGGGLPLDFDHPVLRLNW